MSNLRKHTRRVVNFPAKIDFGSPAALHDCVLVDVSADGARLALDEVAGLPPDFTVVLSYRGVPRRRCHVVWRSTDEIGVRFTDGEHAPRKRRALADRSAEIIEDRSAAMAGAR